MKKKTVYIICAAVLILGFAITGFTEEMSSANFSITTSVVSGGGAPTASTNYQTDSTLGQPSPLGISSSRNYINYPGFWPMIKPTQPAKYTLTVIINPESTGSVSLDPLGGIYNDGQLVFLKAYNASGYVFDSWAGEVADTTRTATTVTMDKDKTVLANFAEDSDNDEMPDLWEEQYGLNPYVNDASDDPDNDGFSNIKEYRENTDPNNPDSHPHRAMPWIPLLLLDE